MGKVILTFFGLYTIWLLWGWFNLFTYDAGWEMGESAFFLIWSAASFWTLVFSTWTIRLRKSDPDNFYTRLQYFLILAFGVFPLSLIFLYGYQ